MAETTTAVSEQGLDHARPLETEQDEASIMSSLARLQEVHITLRNLRETIPKVMDSVLLDPLSPDQLHTNFSQAANGAAQAIKHFAALVEDSKTKEVMEKAKQSRAENREGITGWQVTEHEDWLDVKQEAGNQEMDKEEDSTADAGDGSSSKDVNAALDRLRTAHMGVEASLNEDSRTVTLYLPPPAQISFQIQLNTTPEGHNSYGIDSKGNSKLHGAIVEAIRGRTRANDLNYLLEMLASYSDIKSRPCAKCSLLLDRNAQFPIIRSRKRIEQPDGRYAHDHEAEGGPTLAASAAERMPSCVPVAKSNWTVGFGLGPFNTTPDIVIRSAVSPSCEIVFAIRISALKTGQTNEFFLLSKKLAIIAPAKAVVVRMLKPWCFPVTPNRSLRLTSVLFCYENVGAFVGDNVFPSAPYTSMLIVWPYELPSVVLSPRADRAFRWSCGAP